MQTVTGAHPTDLLSPLSLDDTQLEAVVEDAMRVTIELDYTHLWVDPHCVFQDDEVIKDVQLRHMNAVYQTAEVTIVAAAGQDSSFGLPGVGKRARSPQDSAHVQGHALTAIPPDPSRHVKSTKWATRGWTYQEGVFARHRLFFNEHEVSYECAGLLCREAIALPRRIHEEDSDFSPRLQGTSWLFPTAPGSVSRDRGLGSACALVRGLSEYMARDLTRKSDILNAMLGTSRFMGLSKNSPPTTSAESP